MISEKGTFRVASQFMSLIDIGAPRRTTLSTRPAGEDNWWKKKRKEKK